MRVRVQRRKGARRPKPGVDRLHPAAPSRLPLLLPIVVAAVVRRLEAQGHVLGRQHVAGKHRDLLKQRVLRQVALLARRTLKASRVVVLCLFCAGTRQRRRGCRPALWKKRCAASLWREEGGDVAILTITGRSLRPWRQHVRVDELVQGHELLRRAMSTAHAHGKLDDARGQVHTASPVAEYSF